VALVAVVGEELLLVKVVEALEALALKLEVALDKLLL